VAVGFDAPEEDMELNVSIPTPIQGLQGTAVRCVSCGPSHWAAVSRDGRLFTWGDAWDGKLGHGSGGLQMHVGEPRRVVQLQTTAESAQLPSPGPGAVPPPPTFRPRVSTRLLGRNNRACDLVGRLGQVACDHSVRCVRFRPSRTSWQWPAGSGTRLLSPLRVSFSRSATTR